MNKTKIKWTDFTWNVVTGCTKVSEGCHHCYAKRIHDARHKAYLAGKKMPAQYAVPFETVLLQPDRLDYPLRLKTPHRIFVNSVSDLFHEDIPFAFVDRVFAAMIEANWHTYQVLTKRPERMRDYFDDRKWGLPTNHVWPGVSVEDQATADERIPLLSQTPASVRFVSYEPALGPVDWLNAMCGCDKHGYRKPLLTDKKIGWIIVGGESGSKARPFDLAWARGTVAQCKAAGVPVFIKQLGAHPVSFNTSPHDNKLYEVAIKHRAGADPSEWPEDLRVQEFPA